MNILDGKFMNAEIQDIITGKVEIECAMCMGEYDLDQYAPMIMCMNQHSCCAQCVDTLLKNQFKQLNCPQCNQPINKKIVTKNRLLVTIFQIIKAYKTYVSQLQFDLQSCKREGKNQTRGSLARKNSKMLTSLFVNSETETKTLKASLVIDDIPISKSQMMISGEKRREILLNYAEREKIEELIKIGSSDTPLDQIIQIRSGYGRIKKIECMEYFPNLKELLLYNNHIEAIEGLQNNVKLNILALGYNRISKVENIHQLKELRRFQIECNKITRASAQYLARSEWKNLESLSISFHEESTNENEDCFGVLFNEKTMKNWPNLKSVYIYHSKGMSQFIKNYMRQFSNKKKIKLSVYWN